MNYAMIMAGGAGTRLWPLSREKLSKPALKLLGEESMFQIAVKRLSPLFAPEQIIVVSGREHAAALTQQVPEIPSKNYLLEPMGRGTAAAVGLAAIHLYARDKNATMAVLTADHYIGNTEKFRAVISAAIEIAQKDYLVTLGIQPTSPSTQFGYIERGETIAEIGGFSIHQARRFVEKPDLENAMRMLETGNYTWNSGMFIWKVDVILAEFAKQMPHLHQGLMKLLETIQVVKRMDNQHYTLTDEEIQAEQNYSQVLGEVWLGLQKQTIDYGVMEHAQRVAVIPVDMEWMDIGNWADLKSLLPADENNNSVIGNVLLLDSNNTFVMGGKRLISAVGLKDMVIVDTADALLICPLDQVGKVRQIVAELNASEKMDLL